MFLVTKECNAISAWNFMFSLLSSVTVGTTKNALISFLRQVHNFQTECTNVTFNHYDICILVKEFHCCADFSLKYEFIYEYDSGDIHRYVIIL